jgi:pimeloyl-ACP methyl ester carboxylesterase
MPGVWLRRRPDDWHNGQPPWHRSSCLTREENIAPPDDWVQRMIDTPGRPGWLQSGDHLTHYLEWGDPSNSRVLLLLHGFRGHAHWWDFVAPWFAEEYRVIAIDFAGMGDSSPKLQYTRAGFVAEVHAAIMMAASSTVTLVGHSFGGRIAVLVAHQYPQLLEQAMVIDSNIGFADRPSQHRFAFRPKKVYPELETACDRFRFVPDEPPISPRIMRHLALHSIKHQEDGFVWKYDEALLSNIDWQVAEGELLPEIQIPLDFIAGEFSAVVPPDLAVRIGRALRHGRGPVVIPSAYHHVPVDQPLALAAAMRALLS